MDEIGEERGLEEDGEDEAEHGTIEVGIVPDVVGALLCHVGRIGKIERTENERGNADGDENDADLAPGHKEDAGKHHCRHRARCA